MVVPSRPCQGDAALSRGPSRRGSSRVSNPFQSHPIRIAGLTHSRETSLSLHPSIPSGRPRAFAPLEPRAGLGVCLSTCTDPCTNVWPSDHQSGERSCSHRYPHDHFMETISSRPEREHFIAALPWSHPIEQGLSCPLHPRPTVRRLELRHLDEDGPGYSDCKSGNYISGNVNCSDLYNLYSKYNLQIGE